MVRELSLFSCRRRRQRKDLFFASNFPMGGNRECEARPFWEAHGERMRGRAGNCLIMRHKVGTMRLVKLWHRLPRAVVVTLSLEMFKLIMALNSLL